LVRGAAGAGVPQQGGLPDELIAHFAASFSVRDAVIGVGFDHDLIGTGGLGSVLRQTGVYATAAWRVAPGLTVRGALAWQQFDALGPDGLEVKLVEPRVTVTWNLAPGAAVALRYRFLQRDTNFEDTLVRGNRIDVTMVMSF
jgi:hypothetical protein